MILGDVSLGEGLALAVFFFLVFGGGSIIITVVSIISKNRRKASESEALLRLKQSMVERGMSAEEIERVLKAGKKSDSLPAEE